METKKKIFQISDKTSRFGTAAVAAFDKLTNRHMGGSAMSLRRSEFLVAHFT
jgi:hypothetical protein